MSESEGGNKLWWVLGILLILIGIFYFASTSTYGGRGIFPYFGAKYTAPTPVTPVSGGAGKGGGGGWPDLSPLIWLLLIPLLYGLFRGGKFLWGHRGSISRRIPRPTGQGIELEISAVPQQIGLQEISTVRARLVKNGRPMWKLPWRKANFEIVHSPGGVLLKEGGSSVSGPGEILQAKIGADGYAKAELFSGTNEGVVEVKASWSSIFYGRRNIIFNRIEITISSGQAPPGAGRKLLFEADKYYLPADGSSSAALTATLEDSAGVPVDGAVVNVYIDSFAPASGPKQESGPVDFKLSDNGQESSAIFGDGVNPLSLKTGSDGKARVTLTAGIARGNARICAMHSHAGDLLQKFLNIGIGVEAPGTYEIRFQPVPIVRREGEVACVLAEVLLNGSVVDETIVFTVSDLGGTDAVLIDRSDNPVSEIRTGKDALSGFAMARLRAGARSGDVIVNAVLEKHSDVSSPVTVRFDITEHAALRISSMYAEPPVLEAEGQVCQVGAVLSGPGDVSGKEIEFTISERQGASDASLVFSDAAFSSLVAKTDGTGTASVSLRAGKESGKVRVMASILADRQVSESIEVEIKIKTGEIIPFPRPPVQIVPPQGSLLIGTGQGVSIIISSGYVTSEASTEGHIRTVSAVVFSTGDLAGREIRFFIEKSTALDAVLLDSSGRPQKFVSVLTDAKGVATVLLRAGSASGDVTVRAVLWEDKTIFSLFTAHFSITEFTRFSTSLAKHKLAFDVRASPNVLEQDGLVWVFAQLSSEGESVSGRNIAFYFSRTYGNVEVSFIDHRPSIHVIFVRTNESGLAVIGLRLSGMPGKVRVRAVLDDNQAIHGFTDLELKKLPKLPVREGVAVPQAGLFIDVSVRPQEIRLGGSARIIARVFRDGKPMQKADLIRVSFKTTSAPKGTSLTSFRHEKPYSVRRTGEQIDGSVIKLSDGVFSQVVFKAGKVPGKAVVRAAWSVESESVFTDVDIYIR